MIEYKEIKDLIQENGYKINQEIMPQSAIINLKIVFSNKREDKVFEYNLHNVKYIKELTELLSVIYNRDQDGILNVNFGKMILRLYERKNKFPIFMREIFKDNLFNLKHWSESDKISAITDYVNDISFLSNWRAQNRYDKLIDFIVEIHYPKIILDVTPSEETFDRTIIY